MGVISLRWITLGRLVAGAEMTWSSMAVYNYAGRGLTCRLIGAGGILLCFAGGILMFRRVLEHLSRQRLD